MLIRKESSREKWIAGRRFPVNLYGFTLVEVLVTISIVGILSAISVPSILAWRRFEIVNGFKRELRIELEQIAQESKRWGATCSLTVNAYIQNGKPYGIVCAADGSQRALQLCNRVYGCNISLIQKNLKSYPIGNTGDNLVGLQTNLSSFSYTPRGQLSAITDPVFVVYGTSYLGGSPASRCIVLQQITGETWEGRYAGSISQSSYGSIPVNQGISKSRCLR